MDVLLYKEKLNQYNFVYIFIFLFFYKDEFWFEFIWVGDYKECYLNNR